MWEKSLHVSYMLKKWTLKFGAKPGKLWGSFRCFMKMYKFSKSNYETLAPDATEMSSESPWVGVLNLVVLFYSAGPLKKKQAGDRFTTPEASRRSSVPREEKWSAFELLLDVTLRRFWAVRNLRCRLHNVRHNTIRFDPRVWRGTGLVASSEPCAAGARSDGLRPSTSKSVHHPQLTSPTPENVRSKKCTK